MDGYKLELMADYMKVHRGDFRCLAKSLKDYMEWGRAVSEATKQVTDPLLHLHQEIFYSKLECMLHHIKELDDLTK